VLVIDIVAVLVIIGLGLVAAAVTNHWVKKNRLGDPEFHARQRQLKGEQNALVVELRTKETCAVCNGMTTPTDLFAEGEWYHQSCYKINRT